MGTITETAVSTTEEYDSSIILLGPRLDLPPTVLEALKLMHNCLNMIIGSSNIVFGLASVLLALIEQKKILRPCVSHSLYS